MTARTGFIDSVARFVENKISRRGFITKTAIVGSAVTVGGWDFILKPQSAYATVCGPLANCGDPWTAMCCSINKGVNQCPPGSFAAGWWKADGASLCGGKARYIVDCNAKCDCGCADGGICRKSCWNCNQRCADDKCDHRAVCRNAFRYGQCNTDVSCSGGVWCRTVSCTPPWEWANCNRSVLVSNATVDHSASCLPQWGPIEKKYKKLGSQGSELGYGKRTPVKMDRGKMQRYTDGRIYFQKKVGAHYLVPPISTKYRHLATGKKDETRSVVGLPISDMRNVPGGKGADFQTGAIYQADGQRASAIWGDIHAEWKREGGPAGPLGLPTSDLEDVNDPSGSYATFTTGGLFQERGQQPIPVLTVFWPKYQSLQTYAGVLGFPRTARRDTTDVDGQACAVMTFANGAIVQRIGGAVSALWGPIYRTWARAGGVRSPVGVPISDVRRDGAYFKVVFAHGYMRLNPATGQVTTTLT